jgi:hypothetical protein
MLHWPRGDTWLASESRLLSPPPLALIPLIHPPPYSPPAGQSVSHPYAFSLPFQARLNEVVKYREARAKLEGQEVFRYTRARRRRRNKDKEVRTVSPPRAALAAQEIIEFGKSSTWSRNPPSKPSEIYSNSLLGFTQNIPK